MGAKTLSSNRVGKARKMKQKLSWKQRFRNWLNNDYDSDQLEVGQDISTSDELGIEGMRFQLYRAAGGYVVETRYYDQKNDRNHNKLYIIRDDQDVGEEIGKIITMESLR